MIYHFYLLARRKMFQMMRLLKKASLYLPNTKIMEDNISLSRNRVTRRIEEMANNVSKQIKYSTANSSYFSLAIEKSCDITDSVQLLLFVRCINDSFDIFQELFGLSTLSTKTTGRDIFEGLKNCVEKCDVDGVKLQRAKLQSICTDGAPFMVGKRNGCVSLLEESLERKLFSYHCIIYKDGLCAKDTDFNHVISPVVSCVNVIQSRTLNRRELRELSEEEIN
jgi:hypothetical protein